MLTPKQYYANYQADNNLCPLNHAVVDEVLKFNPDYVFEFGSGTGKNLKLIQQKQTEIARSNISVAGLDLSFINTIISRAKNDLPLTMCGDEYHLRHLTNFDVVFTVSVLDHIEDINGIITEFKRISNKGIVLAETNSKEDNYYYRHNYELYTFKEIGFKWHSPDDDCTYKIWTWNKFEELT